MVFAGCAQPAVDGQGTDAGEPTTTGPPTTTASPSQSTPVETATDSSPTGVTTGSEFVRVEAGETARMRHAGRNVSISYTRDEHTSSVVVSLDGTNHRVTRNQTASADTVSWSLAGRRFVLNPVEPTQRDGQTVYLFGDRWNTSHVELEVYCADNCS